MKVPLSILVDTDIFGLWGPERFTRNTWIQILSWLDKWMVLVSSFWECAKGVHWTLQVIMNTQSRRKPPACFSAPAVHTSFWAQSLLPRPLCLHITNPCRLTLWCKERIKKCGKGKRGELLCREGSPTAVLMSFRDLLYLNEKDCVATGPPLAGIRGQGRRI